VVAVAALMATVGAGSAAATETALCKQPTTFAGLPRCEPNHLYPANMTLTLTNTKIRVLWTITGDECIFDPGHTGVLTGGAMATIDWAGTLVNTGGFNCPPGNANWNGNYTVTTPEPLWISM
jgi:hypothetical protein